MWCLFEQKVIATYYSSGALTDIKEAYKKHVSMDVDLATGKANLKISSITLADNKEFECRLQIPGDTEGTLFDTVRLVVLGNIFPLENKCASHTISAFFSLGVHFFSHYITMCHFFTCVLLFF